MLIVLAYIHGLGHPTNVATFNFIRFTSQIENFSHHRPKVRKFKYAQQCQRKNWNEPKRKW